MGVLALDVSSGSPAMLLRLEELLWGLWLLEEAIRWDTRDTDGSQTDTHTQMINNHDTFAVKDMKHTVKKTSMSKM